MYNEDYRIKLVIIEDQASAQLQMTLEACSHAVIVQVALDVLDQIEVGALQQLHLSPQLIVLMGEGGVVRTQLLELA